MSGRRASSPGNTRKRSAISTRRWSSSAATRPDSKTRPVHVVCDTHLFRIETRWTNEAPAKYEFELDDLADPANLDRLRSVFVDPDKLRSGRTRDKLTKEAADKFQTISDQIHHRNPDREAVAHFVNQLVFCFLADSVGLLPQGMWRKLLQTAERRPERAKHWLDQLFADMKDGGDFNLDRIASTAACSTGAPRSPSPPSRSI